MPIAYAIGYPSILYILTAEPAWLRVVPQRLFYGMNSFVFLAIPFFIMAGEIMSESKITDRIIRFSDSFVGHLRGGLAQVNVLSSMLFAGISGSALSDVAGLGSVFIPAMEKSGYERKFAAALTAAAALQGPIIPPSIIVVVYAGVMGTSVGALFAAGIVPGILMGLTACVLVAFTAKARNYPKRLSPFSIKEVAVNFLNALPALLLPLIIIGGIFGGIFTPTEAAAVAAVYGLILGFAFLKTLTPAGLLRVFKSSVMKSTALFFIIAFANVFSWVLAREDVPQLIGKYVFGWTGNVYVLLFITNLIFLFVGTWLEAGAALILLAPIFGPALINLGIHPVHLGMIIIVNLVIGLLTPPFGIVLYAAASVSGCSIEDITREAFPYLITDVCVLFVITYFPDTVLFIPRVLGLA